MPERSYGLRGRLLTYMVAPRGRAGQGHIRPRPRLRGHV